MSATDATTAKSTPPQGNEPKPTTYVVLRRSSTDGQVWVWHMNIEARSTDAAIRAAAAELDENETKDDAVMFVAVPSSSWKPRAAAVKVERKVVLA